MNKKGFTLTELLAVIALLAIVIAIAVPAVNNITIKAKEKELKNKINLIETAAVFCKQQQNSTETCNTIAGLIASGYLLPDTSGDDCPAGCMINPTNNLVMNGSIVFTEINGKTVATYDES